MAGPDKIGIYFVTMGEGNLAMVRTELDTAEGEKAVAKAEVEDGQGAFIWNIKKGKLRLFALALVRAARLAPQTGEAAEREMLLFKAENASSETRRCTETQIYDLTTYKECAWLAAILSPKGDWPKDAKPRYSRWLRTHNIRGKDSSGPPTVTLDAQYLPPQNVEIFLDDKAVGAEGLDWIESVLAAHIDSSFPPYFESATMRTAGVMPCVGPTFGNREQELAALSAMHSDSECALVEIVGPSGTGKTALARWWIRQALFRKELGQELLFSWSFPRQSRSEGTRQSLASFFRALGGALSITIKDGLTPSDLADCLLEGMKATKTFLFLDGVEALLSNAGEFSIGGERGSAAEPDAETTLHYDSLIYFLAGIVSLGSEYNAFVLITTREPIGKILELAPPRAQVLKIGPYPGVSYRDEELEREGGIAIEDRQTGLVRELATALREKKGNRRGVKSPEALLSSPMVEPSRAQVSPRMAYLVRKVIESYGLSRERCLLYIASCFDRGADWDTVMHVIGNAKGAGALVGPWQSSTMEELNDAYENLVADSLAQPSGGGSISLHAEVHQSAYEDFRQGMPECCTEVHRCLFNYYSALPEREFPDNIDEMQPLFRACWHGCNAGDFKKTFDEVAYSRIFRKWQAYVVFTLGEYEEALQLLNLFTADGETFPASDLDEATRIALVHGCGLSLRYVDRLKEAYRVEKFAWERSMNQRSKAQLGGIASNLLRLHHIFGDLSGKAVTSVLWSLLGSAIPRIVVDAREENIPKSLVPEAMGYAAGIAALIQACRGKTFKAKTILRTAQIAAKFAGSKNKYLMPGLGTLHHALALLEIGEWQTVLDGFKAGELDAPKARYAQTGAIAYIKGRALAESSTSQTVQLEALAQIEECLRKARKNFKWWKGAALQEVGNINLNLQRVPEARAAFEEELEVATNKENGFKLLEVDSLLGLARCELALGRRETVHAHAQNALDCLKQCGFEARQATARQLLLA